MAVVVGRRRHRQWRGPLVAGVPAPLRPRTHLPTVQTNPGLDPPEDPHPAGSRPLDLADHHRLHPTPPGPALGRRPAPSLGTPRPAGSAHSGPGPPRVSKHPPDQRPTSRCAETRQTRPRPATRLT